jgi:hypothetical protein
LRRYTVIILTYIALMSCETQFDFEQDGQGVNQFIVNGVIDNSDGPYYVSVQRTMSGVNPFPNDITTASVEIVDDVGNREMCAYQQDGIYSCHGQLVRGTSGRAYGVIVQVGDTHIVSSMDTMPLLNMPKHEISWKQGKLTETSELGIDVQTEVVFVTIKAELPESEKHIYLHWLGEEIYQFLQKQNFGSGTPPCYIISNYGGDQVRIFSNKNFKGKYVINNALFREIDDSFLRKHLISIFQHSISHEYYQYLEQIKILVENIGSLFDSPAGIATGNLVSSSANAVNGFFRSVLVDTTTVAIYPSQLNGVLIRDDCTLYFTVEKCFGCPKTGKYSGFDRPKYYHSIN